MTQSETFPEFRPKRHQDFLDGWGRRFSGGDVASLFMAIKACLLWKIPVSGWVIDALSSETDRVIRLVVASRLTALRERGGKRLEVWARVLELRARGAKPRNIFRSVGGECGVSNATAKHYFDDVQEALRIPAGLEYFQERSREASPASESA